VFEGDFPSFFPPLNQSKKWVLLNLKLLQMPLPFLNMCAWRWYVRFLLFSETMTLFLNLVVVLRFRFHAFLCGSSCAPLFSSLPFPAAFFIDFKIKYLARWTPLPFSEVYVQESASFVRRPLIFSKTIPLKTLLPFCGLLTFTRTWSLSLTYIKRLAYKTIPEESPFLTSVPRLKYPFLKFPC